MEWLNLSRERKQVIGGAITFQAGEWLWAKECQKSPVFVVHKILSPDQGRRWYNDLVSSIPRYVVSLKPQGREFGFCLLYKCVPLKFLVRQWDEQGLYLALVGCAHPHLQRLYHRCWIASLLRHQPVTSSRTGLMSSPPCEIPSSEHRAWITGGRQWMCLEWVNEWMNK